MFGKNPKLPSIKGDGSVLLVKNIFKTLQGEGPYQGRPAIFIRLGGCNLACSFCDTEFDEFVKHSADDILKNVQTLSNNSSGQKSIFLVVITGGEPFRQQVGLLCKMLIDSGYTIQIETNGTLYQDIPDQVKIICSPKITNSGYHKIREDLLPKITAFKYLISSSLPGYDNIPDKLYNPYNAPVYVQPMDEYDDKKNIANEKLAIKLALEYGYILSYQIHKKLGIE